jgi:iron complex transport system ATP-binding protein
VTLSPALEATDLVVGYRTKRQSTAVLGPVDLALLPGTLTCSVGPNGAGKSTLLRTLCGVQAPLSGTVSLGGRPIAAMSAVERARVVAVVGTERPAADLLTVFDAVAMGRHPHTGWAATLSSDDQDTVRAALSVTGLDSLGHRHVDTLSDGERQRVSIACALAQQPRVLILDEPTAFLDVNRRVDMIELLLDLAHNEGLAVLLCTHDLELALPVADRVWCIANGTCAVGSLDEVDASGALAGAFGTAICHDPATGRVHIALTRPRRV